jgi:hypothetical protein
VRPTHARCINLAKFVLSLVLLFTLVACSTVLPDTAPTPTLEAASEHSSEPEEDEALTIEYAEISFQVEVPENTPTEQPVFINILEEVTGLALSAQANPMEPQDGRIFATSLQFPLGSVVKYRYSRQTPDAPVEEHTSDGRQVRYRLFYVQGPAVVQDVVSRWTDTSFESPSGRIMGAAIDARTKQPIPNLLVASGGSQALTRSDGTFIIEGLPSGTHNLVGYALDGGYRTFQQGALVAADSTTFADFTLNPAKLVEVVFEMSAPENTTPAVPVRLAGNLYQLGNTFADLSGGFSSLASRMPQLSPLPNNHYTISLMLPAGADIRYLYTMGDGFWNAEVLPGSSLRQLIVPDEGGVISDTLASWSTSETGSLAFDVNVPDSTPPSDQISIQLNPLYGWTEPLPLWKLSENRWIYVLNSPLEIIDTLGYRVCRNAQCSAADDAQTSGPFAEGNEVATGPEYHEVRVDVASWAWYDPDSAAAQPPGVEVATRGPDYVAGVEWQARYHPSWTPLKSHILDGVQLAGGNWSVLAPTWSYTRSSPPILEIVAGRDAFWFDLTDFIAEGRQHGQNIGIFPTPDFGGPYQQWWIDAKRDFPWWVVWFDQYNKFILHHADLAARSDAQALVIGGSWVEPAIPGGRLADGSPSGVPADSESRWREIITQVRARYDGQIWWAMPFSQAVLGAPSFLDSVDGIYLLFSEPLTSRPDATQEEMEAEAARLADAALLPLRLRFDKPLILAPAYASADGAGTACLPDPAGGCLPLSALEQPASDLPGIPLDLQEQADIYRALLSVANSRTWIDGFISRGYYPPAALQDKSASVNGKPARDILAYYYPRLTGATP